MPKMRAMAAPSATLLIVEDDPEISRLVAEFMQREGFAVECAGDGGDYETSHEADPGYGDCSI